MVSPDPRAETSTPIPEVEIFNLEEETKLYIRHKRDERRKGYTLENLFVILERVTDNFAEYKETNDRRVLSLETKFEKHLAACVLAAPQALVPPMRAVEDTGSFHINEGKLAEAQKMIAELAAKNQQALQSMRDQQMQEKLAEKQAIIIEFQDSRKWWTREGIKWIAGGIGAAIAAGFAFLMGRILSK